VLNERAKGELRKANADSELQYAKADAVRNDAQSRADVARTDANSRSVIASGEGAVLQGKASVLNERAKGEVGRVNANSELQSSRAEAVRKEADGKLAVQHATAANITTVARYQNEALREQVSAMKSFAESLGSLGFRVISAQGR
jgi:fructose/tagatose bisphosphate aldolase